MVDADRETPMRHCEFCNMELPVNAQYCGNCGHRLDDRYATVTDYGNPVATSDPTPQTPPLFSSPQHPDLQDFRTGWQDTDSSFQTRWDVEGMEQIDLQFTHRITDENDAVLPDLLLPGMLAMQSQVPSPAQVPMVQGTPQFGGVPSVQGSPVTPGNIPQSIPGPANGAASVPPYAPQEAQSIPIQHQQLQYASSQPPAHFYQPVHLPKSTPPPHELEPHDHSGSLHEHRTHSSRLNHSSTSSTKVGTSAVSKWLIMSIAALVIIGSSSIFLAHAFMPTAPSPMLQIAGSNIVRVGSVLSLHGQGFHPGDGVTLTIDNGLPVSLTAQYRTKALSHNSESNTQVIGLSQMNIAGALEPHSADNATITVSSTGTFDATITVPSSLPAGKHTIRAKDHNSSLNASQQFTIPSTELAVNPTALDFGSVEVGRTVKLLVTLSNQGGASVLWTAAVVGSNTNWLALSKSSAVLGTNGLSEPVIVTANTNGLPIGVHTATLRFHTDKGDVQTVVKIHVVSIGQSAQQANLNVSQQSLDFGQLQAGQQAQQNISIANLGNLPLQWQASTDTGSANWLSLAMTKGTVQPGAIPQMVQVKVDTGRLVAGSYSGTIHLTSNGGNAQIRVTLVVTGSTQTPTPSQSPIVTPSVTSINPTNGLSNGVTNVTITGKGFSGATGVSFGQTPASTFNVVSDSQVTATSPAGIGTVDVTVTTPTGTSVMNIADQFIYKTATPIVTSISPASGSSNGGTNVTITGKGFSGATGVSFGKIPASNVSVVSDTQITATSPTGSGVVDVIIAAPGGSSTISNADQYTYTTPFPTVTAIKPNSGPSTGGTNVTIDGTDFTGATRVSFGQTAVSNFTVVSNTQIAVTSPAGTGTVDVTVTTPGGASTTSSADQFTYTIAPPTVTGISPTSGLTTGGTIVTISGTGFTGATGVYFGKTAISNFNVVSDTQITVTSPAGSGTVDITVTTAGGPSAISSADQFTYTSPPLN
jgi:IPT/TIG domain